MSTPAEHTVKPFNWVKLGVFFSTLAILILVCVFGFGYFQLAKVNLSLAQQVNELSLVGNRNAGDILRLNSSISGMQQAVQQSQETTVKQQQLLAEWTASQKGNLNKWYVAEAQYLVRLANDNMQYTANIPVAISLLERADQTLQSAQGNDILELRKSLANQVAALRALPQVDVTAIYLQLNALDQQLEQLPMPASPLSAENVTASPTATITDTPLPWWKKGLANTWEALSKIVIVRYNATNTLPLIMPDERRFLYQNMHAEFANAMWGLLHHNPDVFQISLQRLINWTQLYFVQEAPATRSMLQNLQALKNNTIKTQTMNLDSSLQLFDAYLTKAG